MHLMNCKNQYLHSLGFGVPTKRGVTQVQLLCLCFFLRYVVAWKIDYGELFRDLQLLGECFTCVRE